jgi:hypothetical protein
MIPKPQTEPKIPFQSMPLSLTQRAGPSVSRPSPRSRNRRISLGFSAALKTRHFSYPICLLTLQATASDQIHRALPGYTSASPFFTFLCAPKIASTFSTIRSSLRWSFWSIYNFVAVGVLLFSPQCKHKHIESYEFHELIHHEHINKSPSKTKTNKATNTKIWQTESAAGSYVNRAL